MIVLACAFENLCFAFSSFSDISSFLNRWNGPVCFLKDSRKSCVNQALGPDFGCDIAEMSVWVITDYHKLAATTINQV